jgi:glycogen debranching enzyme
MTRRFLLQNLTLLCCIIAINIAPTSKLNASDSKAIATSILENKNLPEVLERAKSILGGKLTAGSGYGEVWIRDLNTFIEIALLVQEKENIRLALLNFFHFQGEDGNIIDGYIPAESANVGYDYYLSTTRPKLRGHKNTVETDQEASLIQAIYKYIAVTGDSSFLATKINGKTVTERMHDALTFLLSHRFDDQYGLIWGATTVDWGDVQPEHSWGVALDESSHRCIDIYDNAMFLIAVDNYLELTTAKENELRESARIIRNNVRANLWDAERQKFHPHIYIDESPFPPWFDEDRIHYQGGTAIAIEAGLLAKVEILSVLNDMINNKHFSGAASVGLTVYPVYPEGFFQNKGMKPFSYQNGGDWTWFGGRMIQQLIKYGFIQQAYEELLPMTERVQKNDGFFEWYTVKNEPKGSGVFRGSAGVLGKAIIMLTDWANENID